MPGESGEPGEEPEPGESGEPGEDPCDSQTCYTVLHRYASAEPDGTPCYYDVYVEHTSIPEDAETYEGAGMLIVVEYPDGWWMDATTQLGGNPRVCKGAPTPTPPAPGDISDALDDVVPAELPVPDLAVDPGEVLTGLPAYLEAQWEDEPPQLDPDCEEAATALPHRIADQEPDDQCSILPDDVRLHLTDLSLTLGTYTFAVTLDATARYVVDWGDGARDEFRIEGEPYPDGVVRHTYQSVPESREVTLSIQEYWSVTWTVEGYGSVQMPGELAPPPTQVTVPISEVQAVVR